MSADHNTSGAYALLMTLDSKFVSNFKKTRKMQVF